MSKSLYDITINELLPNNIASDEVVSSLSSALSTELSKITEGVEKILFYPNIMNLDEKVIDLLAEQFQVDFYDILGLDLNTKRTLVQNALVWHKGKGTKGVIQETIGAIVNNNCIVKEWFEYEGTPYHFKIDIENTSLSKEDIENILLIVNELKNVRSHLETIIKTFTPKTSTTVAAVVTTNIIRTIGTETIKYRENYTEKVIASHVTANKVVIIGSEN